MGTAWTVHAQENDLFASVNGTRPFNGGGSIFQYAPNGTPSTFACRLDRPRGIAFDSAANLYVATSFLDDSGISQGTIFKITPGGLMSTFATGFGAERSPSPINFFLEGLALDSAGNVFVADQDQTAPNFTYPTTIYKVTPGGTVITFASGLAKGYGLAFDSAGNLFAASTNTDQTIYQFTPGETIFVTGPTVFSPDQGAHRPGFRQLRQSFRVHL